MTKLAEGTELCVPFCCNLQIGLRRKMAKTKESLQAVPVSPVSPPVSPVSRAHNFAIVQLLWFTQGVHAQFARLETGVPRSIRG